MIERMKKITFLVTNSEYEGFITSLRNMGVVHIQQLQQGASSPQIQQAMDLEQRYRAAMLALEAAAKTFRGKVSPKPLEVTDKPSDTLEAVEGLQALQTAIEHENDEVRKNIDALEPWGEFDQERLRALEMETGMKVCHYRCSSKYFSQEWVDKYFATPVAEQDKRTYFVTFSQETPDIQAERLYLPQGTLEGFKERARQLEQRMQDARAQMLYANDNLKPLLRQGQVDALNDIQLSRVRLSDESVAGDYLRLMVGWVRADGAQAISERLDSEGIYYDIEDPAFEDDVPIQLTNGSYTKLFEPILRMYSLPNYHDIDPSLFFAPFFMLFFGLCLGDGGYGLIVLVGGALLACKGSGDMRNYGRLGIWLGLMTTICGLLTGTVFGIDLTQQDWAILAPVKPYFINDNGVGPIFGYSPMMVLSVIIGLVQVLLGMVLKGCKAWKNYGWHYAIGSFSWVTAIIAAIVLYGLPACGVQLHMVVQSLLTGIIAVAAVGIFLYNNPGSYKRPALGLLSNIGGGVWSTYGMATGLLGDLLSYIRLFALGLTGGVLGGVFNSLAYDMTSSQPWTVRWLPMLLILLAGHGITFALSMISAFVHPMRLTFVEFFKNAEFEGGGKEFQPFREIKSGE